MKILITGASGSGTTTLGKALSVATNFKHLDVDAYEYSAFPISMDVKPVTLPDVFHLIVSRAFALSVLLTAGHIS